MPKIFVVRFHSESAFSLNLGGATTGQWAHDHLY